MLKSQLELAPIRIAGLRADQSSVDLKQSILAAVRSVEQAYWSLQAAKVSLHSLGEARSSLRKSGAERRLG